MENNAARFDLTLLLEEQASGLKGSLEYNSQLFARERIVQIVEDFQGVLEAIVDNPAIRVWDIALPGARLPAVQLQEQEAGGLLDRFAVQVARNPRAVALSCADGQLTYEELEQHTRRLTDTLRRPGSQPGGGIDLALERSLEAVVACLALLKVGPVCRVQEPVGLLAFLSFCLQQGGYAEGTRAAVWSRLDSEGLLYELLPPLLSGGTVLLVPEEVRFNSQACCDWLIAQEITHAVLPAFILAEIVRRTRLGQSFALETISLYNQVSSEARLSELRQLLPHLRVLNGYGTVGLPWAIAAFVETTSAPGRCSAIGQAIAPHQVYLLDRALQAVPAGVVGELYLAGPAVDRLHHEGSAVNLARLIANPLVSSDGWFYKSGDFARLRLDGLLELVGREQELFEMCGVPVWTAEVAAVLTTCPGVQDAFVQAHEDAKHGFRQVAYIQPEPTCAAASLLKTLHTFARDALPASMVPSRFIVLAQLPRDSHGNVRRAELPLPDMEQGSAEADPQSKLERELAAIWCRILHIDAVGIHDNFFDRGGHSLLLIRLHDELQTTLHLQLSIVDLFKYPTISSLASFVQQGQPELPAQTEVQQLQTRVDRQKDALQRQRALSQERRTRSGTN